MDEALLRVTGEQLAQLMFPQFATSGATGQLTKGMAASPGAAVGKAVFDSATAVEWAARGEDVILVRRETNPDDLGGMIAAVGILTSRGGKTSHAAVVARGMGKTCVCGAEEIDVDSVRAHRERGRHRVRRGRRHLHRRHDRRGLRRAMPVVPSPVAMYFEEGLKEAIAETGEDSAELVAAVDRILRHADSVRRLGVRANADTEEDAERARRLGAEGIGLCRTEHMFLGDRRVLVERRDPRRGDRRARGGARGAAAAAARRLRPAPGGDGRAADHDPAARPAAARVPARHDRARRPGGARRGARQAQRGRPACCSRRSSGCTSRTRCSACAACGSAWWCPGLFALQVRAIAEAAALRIKAGGEPKVEIMVPLVGSVLELHLIRDETDGIVDEVAEREGVDLHIPIGTMIELPRAALTAGQIAEAAEFFSFGTNDLTQTTWGFSRDDVEAAFFAAYLEKGIFTVSPFETLDAHGVGRLVRIAVEEGRAARPDLKLGVCGEHGGDPESVHFFHDVGLDYVSCSPFRVPVARLEAGRAAIS